MVNCHLQSWLQSYLPRAQASHGMFLISQAKPTPSLTRFPLDDQCISSPHVEVSNARHLFLHQAVRTTNTGWKTCFTCDAVNQIIAIQTDLIRNETFVSVRGRVHRPRRDRKRLKDHVLLPMEYYTTIVRTCLQDRFTIKLSEDGQPKLISIQPTKTKWGFNADTLQAAEP